MPAIFISRAERKCCNCSKFAFYTKADKPDDTLFIIPPNVGCCGNTSKIIPATRRACKQFEARPMLRRGEYKGA